MIKNNEKQQEIYGDIPEDSQLSIEYYEAVLPDNVKQRIADRDKKREQKPQD